MTKKKSESLVKPDMEAVLSRTHLAHDLHSFLLPVLESVSNAIHAIEERYNDEASKKGSVEIKFANATDPAKLQITIKDNGSGLNDENFKSFKTPFSGFKLKKRGRGFGRFIAFKVFYKISYVSRFEILKNVSHRAFRFDITQDDEIQYQNDYEQLTESGLAVSYAQPLKDWHDLIRGLNQAEVADEIGSHFLPQFLYSWLPQITIQFDDQEPENISEHFKAIYVQSESGTFTCEIDGNTEELNYSLTKIPKGRSFKNHCLVLSAADRIVGSPRDLTNKIGQPHFKDENDQSYVVIAVVGGDAFENRLNDARTSINLGPKAIEAIVNEISGIVQTTEQAQIDKIKASQSTDLASALRENPILRIGLRGKNLDEYVASRPNNWTAEEFVKDLAVERYRETHDLSKAITTAVANSEDYETTIKSLVERIDTSQKEALAEYVIHRKNVIELVEAARKFDEEGKRSPEDTIHDLVFRRFSDSVETSYFEHNLWLIDDTLSFLPYITSDRTPHGGKRKKGDKVVDLAFFDDSMILGDEDRTTLTIVEFKKPGRNDYQFGKEKADPVEQILTTFEKVTDAGGFVATDGTNITFTNPVRRFAFIIADITPTLQKVLKRHDFLNDWNPGIFVKYRTNEQMLVQVFGYETLVANAKKRNEAFFRVLLGE